MGEVFTKPNNGTTIPLFIIHAQKYMVTCLQMEFVGKISDGNLHVQI